MRLIDASALETKLVTALNKSGKYTPYECGLDDAVFYLNEQPTIDAVEVVRCQECRYFDPKADGTVGFCKCGEVCGYCHSMRVADDFCSYGERRDDHGQTD